MNDVEAWYDDFARKQVNWGINARHRAIMSKLVAHGLEPSQKVLEIGAGIGTQSQLIADYLENGRLTINDISSRSIDMAKKRLDAKSNVSFLVGDVVELEIENQFDAIVCPDVLEHIPIQQHAKLFSMFDSLLKDYGTVYVNIPDPYFMEWQFKHRKEHLQVIDQALHLQEMLDNLQGTRFYMHFLETYELFFHGCDYRFIVLKTKSPSSYEEIHHPGVRFHRRVFNRLKAASMILLGRSGADQG